MNRKKIIWPLVLILAIASITIWFNFSYPTLSFTNFSIDRTQALQNAKDYLAARGVDTSSFKTATVFISEKQANRFLQKAIGFEKLKKFVEEHDFDMFFWIVRFFREEEKEEYRIVVSSASGQIISFRHIIDDSAARPLASKKEATETIENFLKESFGFDPDLYIPKSDLTKTFDHRSELFLSWQKRGVHIPWSYQGDSGEGKLIISARVSGDEILSFSKNAFSVPDQFNRYLARKRQTGVNLSSIVRTLYIILFAASIFVIIVRRNHLAMHATKNFYIGIMLLSFVLSLVSHLNNFQDILFNYKTTSPFDSYFWRLGLHAVTGALFATIAILMPSLSGELLHYETLKDRKEGSFLYYIQSTFFSRHVTEMICLGYFVGILMLGLQSLMIRLGEKYLGVWVEHTWIENLSSAYSPSLTAFTWGYKTSFLEEIMYRLFAICLGKKIFDRAFPNGGNKNLFAAVMISSLLWGFAHSGYPVFPMWFRGLEMTCLGLFLSFIYLRHGIIPVIIGHYLFNVFWRSAEHLFGVSQPFYFYSSLGVLLLPFALGLISFAMNQKKEIRPLRWRLNKHQLYNLEILKTFLSSNKNAFAGKPRTQITREIVSHGWDPAVVEMAIEDFLNA